MGESVYPNYSYTDDYTSNPPSSCANSSYQGSPVSMYSINTDQSRLSPLSSGYFTPMSQQSSSDQINYHEGERELHQALETRFPFLIGQPKRSRKLLTTEQTKVLESILEKTIYPSTPLREAIAHQLGIPPRKVQIWFQNRRQSRRKSPTDVSPSPSETCCNTMSKIQQANMRTLNSAEYQKLFVEVHNAGLPASTSPPRQSDYQDAVYANANRPLPPPKSAHPSMGNVGAMHNRQMIRPRTQSELGTMQQARATVAAAVAAMHHERIKHQHRQLQSRGKPIDDPVGATATSSNLACLNMAAQRYMHSAAGSASSRPAAPPFWPMSTDARMQSTVPRSTAPLVRPRPSPLSLDAHSLRSTGNVIAINSSSDTEGRDEWLLNSATTCSSSAMTPTFPGDVLGRQHIEAGGRLFSPSKNTEKQSDTGLELAPIELVPSLNTRHETLPRIAELMRS